VSIHVVRRRSAEDVRRILEALPDWFGDPEAIDNYVSAAGDTDYESSLATDDAGSVLGVALTRRHFPEAAELHLIAVHPSDRGKGIGRSLVDEVASGLAADGCILLSVHTVGPSFQNEPYAQTRGFYRQAGFTSVEEHVGLDWSGPTLILVRPLPSVRTKAPLQ
jgi:ribosomal protein S18 acetylase RimI-like enzyme